MFKQFMFRALSGFFIAVLPHSQISAIILISTMLLLLIKMTAKARLNLKSAITDFFFFFGATLGQRKQVVNTTMWKLFTLAVIEQHYHAFEIMFLNSWWIEAQFFVHFTSVPERNIWLFSGQILHYTDQLVANSVFLPFCAEQVQSTVCFMAFTKNSCLLQQKMALWECWEWTKTVQLRGWQLNNEQKLSMQLWKAEGSYSFRL